MSDLPLGWAEAPLGFLGTWIGGGTPSKRVPEFWQGGTLPWVSPKDMKSEVIRDTQDHITEAALMSSTTNLVDPGSILVVTRSGILQHTLPVATTSTPVTINQDIKALTPHHGLVPEYIAWGLRANAQRILRECSKAGTTVQSVETTQLLRFVLPIAPTAEQKRIVAAIEEQFSRLEAAEVALERFRQDLKRMRNAVLQAAVNGALITSDGGWAETRLGLIATLQAGSTPKGVLNAPPGEIPFYKVGDMNQGDGHFMAEARVTVSQATADLLGLRVCPAGTVIFPKVGGALYTNKKRVLTRPAAFDTNTMGAIPGETVYAPFLFYWMSGIRLGDFAYGAPIPQVSRARLNDHPFLLPSLSEQERIVAAVEEQLSRLDAGVSALDRIIGLPTKTRTGRVQALRASILSTAFAGKLVAQDPSDEPASVLLRRIAGDRTSTTDYRTTPSRKPPTSPRHLPA